MRRALTIIALALLAPACGQSASHVRTDRRAHNRESVAAAAPIKVTGTPAEVALVNQILSGINTYLNTITLGPTPQGMPLTPNGSGPWITLTYPSSLDAPTRAEAQWQGNEVMDAYAAQCAGAGVPCLSGYSILDDAGPTVGDFSSRQVPTDVSPASPDESPAQLAQTISAAATSAGLTNVQVASATGDGPVFTVTATSSDPQLAYQDANEVTQAVTNLAPH